MAKCPNCKHELLLSDGKYHCPQCGSVYIAKQQNATTTTQQPQTQTTQSQDVNSELEILKARLAALEAENPQKTVKKPLNVKEKLAPVLTFFKSYGKIILPVMLAVIIFITLMTCLVGIRGIYVNVENPNDFYSFTATNYAGYSSDVFGDYVEEGTWKASGSKLTLTVKDEDFGKFSADFVYATKNGYKTLFIGEDKDSLMEYKRVSLVKYDINTAKAKVTFDMNGGSGSNSTQSIKIGSTLSEPNEPTHSLGYTFRGWYTEPFGFKNSGTRFDEDKRIWDNVTYYANWYNPTVYTITLGDITINAQEGDNILSKLQTTETEGYTYEYFLNGTLIDEQTTMPDHDISVMRDRHGKQFTAYFDANGGEFGIEKETFTAGEPYTLPSAIPTKGEFVFRGWEYNGVTYSNNGKYVITPAHDIYFIAKWSTKMEFTRINGGYELTKFNDKNAQYIEIPSTFNGSSVVSIGNRAFQNCTLLKNIIIPDSVTSIGENAFWYCTGLKSIIIPDSVTSISFAAFYGCSGLTSITIPDSVTSIGGMAFERCNSLTSITIPDSVTSIGGMAFYGCSGLKEVYYKSSAEDWAKIDIDSRNNDYLTNATRYYYSETKPTGSGNYWHYVNGVVTVW